MPRPLLPLQWPLLLLVRGVQLVGEERDHKVVGGKALALDFAMARQFIQNIF